MFQRFLEAAAANPIGSDARRSTAAAVPVIANYYLLRSLLNLHRCYCLVLSVAAGGRRFAKHSTPSAEGLRSLINHDGQNSRCCCCCWCLEARIT